MIRWDTTNSRWHLSGWEERGGSSISEDQALVFEAGDILRIAVIDGATPVREKEAGPTINPALWANCVIAGSIRNDDEVREGLARANEYLTSTSHRMSGREKPNASVVVCDIGASGRADFTRVGDCVAWVRRDGDWEDVFSGDMLQSAGRELHNRLRSEATKREVSLAEVENPLYQAPELWRTTPVGLFPKFVCEEAGYDTWEAIVVASDGPRLNSAHIEDLDQWLLSLRGWERANASELVPGKIHDDVTAILVTPVEKDHRKTA